MLVYGRKVVRSLIVKKDVLAETLFLSMDPMIWNCEGKLRKMNVVMISSRSIRSIFYFQNLLP